MNWLYDNLIHAGKQPLPLTFADGSRLLVLPQSGRLLGLYPSGSEENFLWTNPAFATAQSAAEYFRRDGWPNPGGDRTWLAPEIELFIGDLGNPGATYAVPCALDPGKWTLTAATKAGVSMAQTTGLRLHRSKKDVSVRLEKVLRSVANPLPDAGVDYAGYSQITTLEVDEPHRGEARLGIWNLLQLPSPGTMLIPVCTRTIPQKVFGAFAEGELDLSVSGVRWQMSSPGPDSKIALKAGALTGRVGYLCASDCCSKTTQGMPDTGHNSPDTLDLVVREFTVVPEGDYVDALWDAPHETGWAFQACCVRNGPEQFNELEYHAATATTDDGRFISRDESRVWAFRGPSEVIRKAAFALLGPCA